jgi:hypothetical protein
MLKAILQHFERRACTDLKLDVTVLPVALAACCTLPEFQRAFPTALKPDYDGLRSSLAALFDLRTDTFSCGDLRRGKQIRSVGSNAEDSLGGSDSM